MLFVLCAGIQFTYAQNKLELKPGTKYERKVTTNGMTTMSMMGQEMEMTQDAKIKTLIEIIEEKDDHYKVSTKLISISTKASQAGQEVSFDSENEDDMNGPMAEAYKSAIGSTSVMKIDKQGNLIESDDEDNIDDLGSIQEAISIFIALPKDLSVGNTWSVEQNIDNEGVKLKSKRDYKVKSIEGNLVTLEVKGNMDINQNATNEGVEVKSKLKGSISGEIILDKETHVVMSENSFSKMDGNTHASGMDIPMDVSTTTKTKVKKL